MQTVPQSEKILKPSGSGWGGRLPLRRLTAATLLGFYPFLSLAQTTAPAATPAEQPPIGTSQSTTTTITDSSQKTKPPSTSNRRRATKLYLAATKLFLAERFEEAQHKYEQAAKLDPTNTSYPLAAEVARNHAVTALIQAAVKKREQGNATAAREALAHALQLNPQSAQAAEHIYQLGDDLLSTRTKPLYEDAANSLGSDSVLSPAGGTHSFHLNSDLRQTILQVFKAYGVEVTLDSSVSNKRLRFDLDDASFVQAVAILSLLTGTCLWTRTACWWRAIPGKTASNSFVSNWRRFPCPA
jgi:tetratricopeptide (TPR) repeat protein